MTNSPNGSARFLSTKFLAATSAIAILASTQAQAQQTINDGDNITVTSGADGETITSGIGVLSVVDGAPVVVVDNNDVTLENAGTLRTTAVTQTIQVNQNTTGATINNTATGRLEADSRVVNFDGSDATLSNDGVILGTGSQRNGAVYANRTSNNITVNNSTTGTIDAGVEGAGIAIEVGGGGQPRGGAINNAGTIQGRGQAAPSDGTAGDGLRFFGPGLAPDYIYAGDITNSGLINSESTQGTVAGIRFSNRIGFQGTLTNEAGATISGAQNGLYFGNDADHTGGIVNNGGTISSDSRALNIDGTGLVVNNLADGQIIGTGNQRNGTVYADSTAQAFTLNNDGVIDAGAGNEGTGFSVELSALGNDFEINNSGTIQGRGNAAAGLATAGDGVRLERARIGGSLMNPSSGLFTGTITNNGLIDSEGANGTVAGVRVVNGVSFQGTLNNDEGGTISGVQNGLYFGNPTPAGGGDHTGGVANNAGTISSGSRALNIDGTGLVINNLATGQIIGTGNQRNGTAYADSTAQDFTLNNDGLIDAGAGNEGAGFSVELASAADGGNAFTINNTGTIQGRGNEAAGAAGAGDGLRFERTRNAGVLDGTSNGLFNGNITNSGTIASEAANGTAAGIRFVNGTSFAGTLDNSGTISGVQNGLYFGNPTPAGGGDFSAAIVNNSGTISSGSRALNIDGVGLTVNNSGQIIGTGNQRNGTVYADSTAQDFALNNLTGGVIDAGAGNQGAGFSVELSTTGNSFDIVNDGTIQGRGRAGAGAATAGDGFRFERTRNAGVLDGTSSGLFSGSITNSGVIDSEGDSGTTAGIRFVNGVSFNGTIDNSGTISGVQNGLYFGNPTPAGGGDFTGAVVNNSGTISSESRALNIDGTGLVINNSGSILGTGAQRNGTVYADGTANNFTLNNTGTIDAGLAGSGVAFQLGVNDGDARSFTLINDGTIAGRGEAQASGASAGLRLFNGAGAGTTVTVADDIINNGTISSEAGPAVLIENIAYSGVFTNNGTLTGPTAVDSSTALSALNFVQNDGALNGNFVGSAFNDTLSFAGGNSTLTGSVLGGVDVTVAETAALTVSGPQTVEGNFTANGTLNFDLSLDSLAVDGDTVLGANSVVNIATTASDTFVVGNAINILSETGSFTNNGTTINVDDDDFLIDYTVDLGSIIVTPTATNLAAVSTDANINNFGAAVTSAVADNRLPTTVFNALNASANTSAFETTSLTLLPAINDGLTREIFETQRFASGLLNSRLSGDQTGIWGQISYRNADRDAASLSAVGYDADSISFTLGLDTQLGDNAKAGILLNYADINVDAYGPATEQNDINSYQVSAYAGLDFGAAFVNAELGYSFNDVESQRIAVGAAITSESDVDGLIADVSSGYTINTGNFTITPTAGLRYANLSRDSFTENGGFGLSLDTDNTEFLEASLGLNIAGKGDDSKDLSVVPYANVAYSYDLIGDGFGANASFNNSLDSFRLTAGEASESRFDVGAGLNLISKNGFSIGAEYQGRFASDYQSHSGGVRVRFEF